MGPAGGRSAEYPKTTSFWHSADGDDQRRSGRRRSFGIKPRTARRELATVAGESTFQRHELGFPLMTTGLPRISVLAPTPLSVLEYYDEWAKYIVRQVGEGRMGILNYVPYEPARGSPFGTVVQPNKVRVITNLSAPDGAAINAAMDPRRVPRVRLPTVRMTGADVVALRQWWRERGLTDAEWDKYVKVVGFDIDSAYRQCARREIDEWALGGALGDLFAVDFAVSFGGADAVMQFCKHVSDPLKDRVIELLMDEPAFDLDCAKCDGGAVPIDVADAESWREVITADSLHDLADNELAKYLLERVEGRTGDVTFGDIMTPQRAYIDDLWAVILGVSNQIWLLRTIWQVAAACGIPGSRKKLGSGLSTGGSATLLGKKLDAVRFQIEYPLEKLPRVEAVFDEILRRNIATDTMVMSWQGTVQDLCSVAPNLNAFKFEFSAVLSDHAKAPSRSGKLDIRRLHRPVRRLKEFVRHWNGVSLITSHEPSVKLWASDASGKWGLGFFIGAMEGLTTGGSRGVWGQFKWTEFELAFSKEIHVLEALGVLCALECAGPQLRGRRVCGWCDNQAVVDAWKARRARESAALNEIIILIILATTRLDIELSLEYIETAKNVVADLFSRGKNDEALANVDPALSLSQATIPARVKRSWRRSLSSLSTR